MHTQVDCQQARQHALAHSLKDYMTLRAVYGPSTTFWDLNEIWQTRYIPPFCSIYLIADIVSRSGMLCPNFMSHVALKLGK